jgi:hypothetical protein
MGNTNDTKTLDSDPSLSLSLVSCCLSTYTSVIKSHPCLEVAPRIHTYPSRPEPSCSRFFVCFGVLIQGLTM